ncbi:hypothetical protein QJS04_geneDACA018779 [Acorus gramineus]|uniref:Uncharacterized protein n=1 Tax=Acorus gramineus TaxID=55184 RepID=A0AAV9BKQ8_ACOGR|nr:hypothetical protein QJS04_geneDACA018779 [Acorus gramineus]
MNSLTSSACRRPPRSTGKAYDAPRVRGNEPPAFTLEKHIGSIIIVNLNSKCSMDLDTIEDSMLRMVAIIGLALMDAFDAMKNDDLEKKLFKALAGMVEGPTNLGGGQMQM